MTYQKRPRVLGVKIADGFSAEARVFASLFGHRDKRFDAHVIYHPWTPDRPGVLEDHADRFADAADVSMSRIPLGWEPNWGTPRSLPSKLASTASLLNGLPRALLAARKFQPDIIYSSQQSWDCAVASIIARTLNRPGALRVRHGPRQQPLDLAGARPHPQLAQCTSFSSIAAAVCDALCGSIPIITAMNRSFVVGMERTAAGMSDFRSTAFAPLLSHATARHDELAPR